MPKLIFFDIDGTLWDDNMQMPESTVPALKALQKNGRSEERRVGKECL